MLRLCFCIVFAIVTSVQTAVANEVGQGLFEGTLALSATLRHSEDALPQAAITCSNCHKVACTAGRDDPLAPPALGPVHLLSKVKRISGPAVAYDQAGFCRVLRTGRTPAHTVTSRTMPQYIIDDQSCAALWEYLIDDSHNC